MPIIQFSESDKLVAVVAETGVYPAILKSLDQKASSSGSSTNFWAEFELIDGKYKGKELKCCFNTSCTQASLLDGSLAMRPHTDLITLKAALDNISPDLVPLNFDTDELLSKAFALQVLTEPSKGGGLMNIPGAFLPIDKANAANQQVAF